MTGMAAVLHDGSTIDVVAVGDGRAVLLPIRTVPYDSATAETMRAWGADPDAGPTVIAGLRDAGFRVIAADLEGHRMAHPAAKTLTPESLSQDLLAIADAADVDRFAYAGYSWLALCGLQLAIRTDRLWALAMGGYPPMGGPYREMLAVTRAAHAESTAPQSTAPGSPVDVEPGDWDSAQVTTTPSQTRQFVTLYEALQDFDDARAARELTIPRLAYAGAGDEISYSPRWGGVTVRIAPPLREHQAELEAAGWTIRLLPGRDHIGAMRSDVTLPLLTTWLRSVA
ncbi:alpha/beta fold hydrolase [Salinibacterium sp. ZJ450]|uniref:alpha/beta fold hydrolase n=1 Tax=Salinibacterium sp. ZJ450 TaxID=2708338 RepID=UPI001420245E|nr:alpha/beta hydrolase [Salinibacterium sp. ZJ450]